MAADTLTKVDTGEDSDFSWSPYDTRLALLREPPAACRAPFAIPRYRVARSHTLYFRLSMIPTRPSHRLESVRAP